MIHVAQVDLCKELYELSGWNETEYFYQFIEYSDHSTGYYLTNPALEQPLHAHAYPAYDLSYVLRRLPRRWILQPIPGAMWMIEYQPGMSNQEIIKQDEIPEDAVCKVAIELFKRGILEKDHTSLTLS